MIPLQFHSFRTLWRVAGLAFVLVCLQGTVYAATIFVAKPILSVSQMYNDNILFAPSQAKGDFVTSSMLGAYLGLSSPLQDTQLQYYTLAQKYAQYSQYDSVGEAQYASLKHQQELSPTTRISASDDFIRGNLTSSLSPGSSVAFNPLIGRATLQGGSYWSNDSSLHLSHNFAKGLDSALWVHQTTIHTADFGYSFEQGGGAYLGRSVLTTLSAGLHYQFADYRYSNEDPAESHLIQLSLDWRPTARISASALVGPAIIDIFGGPLLVRPGYMVNLSYAGEKWIARVGGGETPSLGAGLGGTGVSQGGSGSFTYSLTGYTSVTADVSYAQYSGGGFDGDSFGYGAQIVSQVTRWLTVYAGYSGFRRGYTSGGPLAVQSIGFPAGTEAVRNVYSIGATVSLDLIKSAI